MHILISFLIFGVLVIVHEWGHFYVARRAGIFVEEFAVGMGPLLLSKRDKLGTLYSIRLLPIGGYCKMYGMEGSDTEQDPDAVQRPNSQSYQHKSVFARMAVILAGSFMNFVLAFVLLLVITASNGFSSLTVSQVAPGSPAYVAGLQGGDRLTHMGGRRLFVFQDAGPAIAAVGANPSTLTINREGQSLSLPVTPTLGPAGNYILGFTPQGFAGLAGPDTLPQATAWQVVSQSFNHTVYFTRLIGYGLIQLATFNVSTDDVAGPLGIVGVIGDVYQQAATVSPWAVTVQMMHLAALLSANLGLFNLLPIPALDGGRMVFLSVEAVRGKAMDPSKEGVVHLVGFVLLLGLIAFVFFNDIANLFR